MAVPPAAGRRPAALNGEPDDSARTDATGFLASSRHRLIALVAMVAAIVVCLGLLVWALADSTDAASSATGTTAEREEVQAVAQQFALRLNTYGPSDLDENNAMPGYVAGVEEVLTPKFFTDFEQNVGIAEQTVAEAGVGREAEVYATGVSDLGDDTATVLVGGTFTNSYPNRQDPEKRIAFDSQVFRYQVTLVRTDGEWLVDNYQTITDLAAGETGDPSGLPSGFETGLPTDPTSPPGGGTGGSGGGNGSGGNGSGGNGSGGNGSGGNGSGGNGSGGNGSGGNGSGRNGGGR